MRVGTLAYSTWQGLGVLAKSFFDHHVVTDVMVVAHGRRPDHLEWFPGAPVIRNLRDPHALEEAKAFCRGVDAMLFFELPFLWELIPFCRDNGVRTALMVMHECSPREWPALPDLFLCPSLLDLEVYNSSMRPAAARYLPVPVDVPWRRRERAEVFVHNAGHGGLRGRNGTSEVLRAWRHVESPARLLVRSQEEIPAGHLPRDDPRVQVQIGTFPRETLYEEGQAFIFPERFNGLSLPLQEARAAGMLVMCGDRFPMNEWLPREPLIPVREYRLACISPRLLEFDEAVIDPRDIAATVDSWYGRDVSDYSISGRAWAQENSWPNLKPRYLEALAG